jgi:hypothetical protein
MRNRFAFHATPSAQTFCNYFDTAPVSPENLTVSFSPPPLRDKTAAMKKEVGKGSFSEPRDSSTHPSRFGVQRWAFEVSSRVAPKSDEGGFIPPSISPSKCQPIPAPAPRVCARHVSLTSFASFPSFPPNHSQISSNPACACIKNIFCTKNALVGAEVTRLKLPFGNPSLVTSARAILKTNPRIPDRLTPVVFRQTLIPQRRSCRIAQGYSQRKTGI